MVDSWYQIGISPDLTIKTVWISAFSWRRLEDDFRLKTFSQRFFWDLPLHLEAGKLTSWGW